MKNKKSETPADIMAAAKTIATRFGGSRPSPILVVVGERSPQDILLFQNEILEQMDIGRIRNVSSDSELIGYLSGDRQPDAIFYRDPSGAPSKRAQGYIVNLMKDERKRHFMPLILVSIVEEPAKLRAINGSALQGEFEKIIGAREVNIASAGRAPIWRQLTNLFMGTIARKSSLRLEPDAAELVEHALKGGATISNDAVLQVVKAVMERAHTRGAQVVNKHLIWEAFPPHFREAVRPAEIGLAQLN